MKHFIQFEENNTMGYIIDRLHNITDLHVSTNILNMTREEVDELKTISETLSENNKKIITKIIKQAELLYPYKDMDNLIDQLINNRFQLHMNNDFPHISTCIFHSIRKIGEVAESWYIFRSPFDEGQFINGDFKITHHVICKRSIIWNDDNIPTCREWTDSYIFEFTNKNGRQILKEGFEEIKILYDFIDGNFHSGSNKQLYTNYLEPEFYPTDYKRMEERTEQWEKDKQLRTNKNI